MSWTPVKPYTPSSSVKGSAAHVTMTCSAGCGTRRRRAMISIRTQHLPGTEAFLAAGKSVTISLGAGEHHGMIRLTPGGGHLIGKPYGIKAPVPTVMIPVPVLPGTSEGRHPAVGCEYDYGDDWLEITLPAWSRGLPGVGAAPAVAAPTSSVAAPKPSWPSAKSKRPFTMLGASVPGTMPPGKRGAVR